MINGHTDYQDTLPGNNTPAADPLAIPAFLRRQPGATMSKHIADLSPDRAHDAAEALKPENHTSPHVEIEIPPSEPENETAGHPLEDSICEIVVNGVVMEKAVMSGPQTGTALSIGINPLPYTLREIADAIDAREAGDPEPEKPPTLEQLQEAIRNLSLKEKQIIETKRIMKKQVNRMVSAL